MIRALAFLELTVSDLPRALHFYETILGLARLPTMRPERFALLATGGSQLALKRGVPTPGSVLIHFEVEDLRATLARLAGFGLVPECESKDNTEEKYRRILVRDLDGYRLCFYQWIMDESAPQKQSPSFE